MSTIPTIPTIPTTPSHARFSVTDALRADRLEKRGQCPIGGRCHVKSRHLILQKWRVDQGSAAGLIPLFQNVKDTVPCAQNKVTRPAPCHA